MRRLPSIFFFGAVLAFPLEVMAEEPSPLFCDVGVIKVQEDRFSGETSAITSTSLSHTMTPTLVWSSKFPDNIGLVFHGQHPKWRYLDCNSTYVLLDNERLSLNPVQHEGDVLSAGVEERIVTGFSWKEADRLRKARVFEYKICGSVFKASDAFLCEARDLIRSVEDWKKKSKTPGS